VTVLSANFCCFVRRYWGVVQ